MHLQARIRFQLSGASRPQVRTLAEHVLSFRLSSAPCSQGFYLCQPTPLDLELAGMVRTVEIPFSNFNNVSGIEFRLDSVCSSLSSGSRCTFEVLVFTPSQVDTGLRSVVSCNCESPL